MQLIKTKPSFQVITLSKKTSLAQEGTATNFTQIQKEEGWYERFTRKRRSWFVGRAVHGLDEGLGLVFSRFLEDPVDGWNENER